MGELQLLLFDMDGVLLDTAPLLKNCYAGLAQCLEVSPPTEKELRDAIQMSPRTAIRYLFGDQGYELLHAFNQLWKDSIRQASAFPGIQELLEELSRGNVVVGTVTSRNNFDTLTLLTSAGLLSYMRTVVTWGRYRIAKPSPICILIALDETGTPSSRAAYVGDQVTDMHAARNAGVLAVGAVWGQCVSKEQLKSAGADIIVEKPAEILSLIKDIL
jgi:HAD superfamily hydrolase (TIGR01549 family)